MSATTAFEIPGKSAIVTGAARGIGFGIAARLVEAGANVLMVDLEESALRAATGRLSAGAGRVTTLAADVAADGSAERIVGRCVEVFGGLDILVNNAGIFPQVPVLEMPAELFDRVLRINLRGLVLLCKAAGTQMVRQGRGGKIVNIGSVDSVHPSMVGLAAYDASKGGVLMFTKSFALEMARHGVQVNLVAPGGVETEGTSRPLEGSGMTDAQMAELKRRFIGTKIPMGRMGTPDDIAKVVLFLASPASDYMSGATVVVDGGMLLA